MMPLRICFRWRQIIRWIDPQLAGSRSWIDCRAPFRHAQLRTYAIAQHPFGCLVLGAAPVTGSTAGILGGKPIWIGSLRGLERRTKGIRILVSRNLFDGRKRDDVQ